MQSQFHSANLYRLCNLHALVDKALSSLPPLHITRGAPPLSRDLITRAPGGLPAPPMDRRVADSGSSGLSDTASYTARPGLGSLSAWSPAGSSGDAELMWRCNDIISYWDDKYRHTGACRNPINFSPAAPICPASKPAFSNSHQVHPYHLR